MVIQHNIVGMNSQNQLKKNQDGLSSSLEKLSSGYQINRAGDNAAGLSISEKMRCEITMLGSAENNVADGISLVKTAEGALHEIHDMLNRMTELAVLSANGTFDSVDRNALQEEVTQLITEIDRIANATSFNNRQLLDGTCGNGLGMSMNALGVNGGWELTENGRIATFEGSGTLSHGDYMVWDDGSNAVKTVRIMVDPDIDSYSSQDFFIKNEDNDYTYYVKDSNALSNKTLQDLLGSEGINVGNYGTVLSDGRSTIIDNQIIVYNFNGGPEWNFDSGLILQIGTTNNDVNQMNLYLENSTAFHLGVDKIDVSEQKSAQDAILFIKTGINSVSTARSQLGAYQNRLEHTKKNLESMHENIQSAEAKIRDTDWASEMMKYTKSSLLIQSGQAMCVHANQNAEGALSLVG